MKQIWKFELPDHSGLLHPITVPKGAVLLTVDFQYQGTPAAWFLVDTEEVNKDSWLVGYFGTGWDIDDDSNAADYVVTRIQIPYVWHFFARRT